MDKIVKESLVNSGLFDTFNKLPPSHQREYLKWINEAKKIDTKKSRIDKMLIMLKQ
jgi:uncharacterized protein YdeI (YjbR/CyaY-like superfamily)